MKKRLAWISLVCLIPAALLALLFLSGGFAFTPLGSLFGDRWHYNGGRGLGRIAPLPNQSAILYSSSRSGVSHICSVPWNSNVSRQLTNTSSDDSDVAVSPNGKLIVFVRQAGDSTHLWLMNVNGTGQHQFTFGPDSQTEPCFSPNGRQIAYVNSPHYGLWRIWVTSAAGGGTRQLTSTSQQDGTPTFDRTGKTVYYSHYADAVSRLQIYAVSAAGGSPRLLGFGTRPTVSPNNLQIAFYDQPQNQTLAMINTNGTCRRTVGTGIGDGMNLAFCSNGGMLTYKASTQHGKCDIVSINPKTGAVQTVATIDGS